MLHITLPLAQEGSHTPLYQQLYAAIAEEIRTGQLATGEKLPGKRSLAASLHLSVNTVDTAYQLLAAEGWLEARPRSGYYVCPYEGALAQPPAPLQAAQEPAASRWEFDLSTGGIDTELFPFRTWGRIQKELLYSQPQLLNHGHSQGDETLRIAIAEYLCAYRGVQCQPDQLVVGAGAEYLLGLLGHLFVGEIAALESPGYLRTQRILENSDLICRPVPIDRQGLNPATLDAVGAKLVYVTPSHQFPTGAVMPVGRRAALLNWASAKPGRLLLEDDYDSEFRFDLRPLPSLQGMGGSNGPVVYLTTFSRSLAPSIRIACMVLPRFLLPEFKARFKGYSSTVSRFEQQTLCRFLTDGHYVRHLARCRAAYRQRMLELTSALQAEFGAEALHFSGQHTGLHLLLQYKNGAGEGQMVQSARAAGVRLSGLSEYILAEGECPPNTVVLGYGALKTQQMQPLAKALKGAWG